LANFVDPPFFPVTLIICHLADGQAKRSYRSAWPNHNLASGAWIMADSETSRTLPSDDRRKNAFIDGADATISMKIFRRNLAVAAPKYLATHTSTLSNPAEIKPLGSVTASQLWQQWHVAHLRRERITKFQQKLEKQMLAAAGSFPVVETAPAGRQNKVFAHSFAEIDDLATELDADQLSQARSELRRRRKQWNEADKKLGFSKALAFEDDLAKQELRAAQELWKAEATSLVEAIAKLHCIIEMEDPGMKLRQAPWPQLRTILLDLIRLE
jgi:hypothetical protein